MLIPSEKALFSRIETQIDSQIHLFTMIFLLSSAFCRKRNHIKSKSKNLRYLTFFLRKDQKTCQVANRLDW